MRDCSPDSQPISLSAPLASVVQGLTGRLGLGRRGKLDHGKARAAHPPAHGGRGAQEHGVLGLRAPDAHKPQCPVRRAQGLDILCVVRLGQGFLICFTSNISNASHATSTQPQAGGSLYATSTGTFGHVLRQLGDEDAALLQVA